MFRPKEEARGKFFEIFEAQLREEIEATQRRGESHRANGRPTATRRLVAALVNMLPFGDALVW